MTKEEDIALLFEAHSLLALTFFVNNAGTNNAGTTADLSAKDFDYVTQVNMMGHFLCARKVFQQSNSTDSAAIVGRHIFNVGSILAQSPCPDSLAYVMSKY